MRTPAPALLPLFRSENQLRLMSEIYLHEGQSRSISELSEATGIHHATVAREVSRLSESGLLKTNRRGRMVLVEPNSELSYYNALRTLLEQTTGPIPVLQQLLGLVKGIERAYIFGSWAARYEGVTGPAPNDVDVLVIGSPSLREVRRACKQAEEQLHLTVNPTVWESTEWDALDSGFRQEVESRPIVQIIGANT